MKKNIITLCFVALIFVAQAQEKKASIQERLVSLKEIRDAKLLQSSLKKLEKSKYEEDRMLAYSFYHTTKDEQKMSLVEQDIIRDFPKGRLAIQTRIKNISNLKSLEERDERFQELLKEYPNVKMSIEMSDMATEYANVGNLDKMTQYATIYAEMAVDRNGNRFPKDLILSNFAQVLSRKNPTAAIPFLEKGLAYRRVDLSKPEEGATEEIRKQRRIRSMQAYYILLTNYANALTNTQRKEESLQLLATVMLELKRNSPENQVYIEIMADSYLSALLANDKYAEAFPYLEENFINGASRLATEESLKKGYSGSKGSLDGYQVYIDSIIGIKTKNEQAQMMKKLVSKDAPDFVLKDVDGETVRLSDLRGKVVVLDFWATWCGPCKASFPAMQKAVDQYKDDKDVRFLFLHTWERGSGDATVNAKKYVTDNKYSFEVLMDLRDPSTKESEVAQAYRIDGIPTKVIIDSKGRIRFETSGFSGDEATAVKELSAMIEFARKS